ncbi:MAG: dockerin type I repeat-containing protein [Oscillospiraceae bacterium]|jgi:hypothetical protein|nr:dockerin type I repeat-containing protein [Oscillospiraceae bacterium]
MKKYKKTLAIIMSAILSLSSFGTFGAFSTSVVLSEGGEFGDGSICISQEMEITAATLTSFYFVKTTDGLAPNSNVDFIAYGDYYLDVHSIFPMPTPFEEFPDVTPSLYADIIKDYGLSLYDIDNVEEVRVWDGYWSVIRQKGEDFSENYLFLFGGSYDSPSAYNLRYKLDTPREEYFDLSYVLEKEETSDVVLQNLADLDGDYIAGKVADVVLLSKYIQGAIQLSDETKLAADLNIDGAIDTEDLQIIVNYLTNEITALPYVVE